MTKIIQNIARNIASEREIKYTKALRIAEAELLTGIFSGKKEMSKRVEDLLPLLRKIKPITLISPDTKEKFKMFVQPNTRNGSYFGNTLDFLSGVAHLPILGQEDIDYVTMISPAIFFHADELFPGFDVDELREAGELNEDELEDVREREERDAQHDFPKNGIPDLYYPSKEIVSIKDRVVRDMSGENPYDDEEFCGLDRAQYAAIQTTVSHLVPNEIMTLHIDLRGLSREKKIDLVADTVNDFHREVFEFSPFV